MTTTVFVCSRGRKLDTVKVQLEINQSTLDKFKSIAKANGSTAKAEMENLLNLSSNHPEFNPGGDVG